MSPPASAISTRGRAVHTENCARGFLFRFALFRFWVLWLMLALLKQRVSKLSHYATRLVWDSQSPCLGSCEWSQQPSGSDPRPGESTKSERKSLPALKTAPAASGGRMRSGKCGFCTSASPTPPPGAHLGEAATPPGCPFSTSGGSGLNKGNFIVPVRQRRR